MFPKIVMKLQRGEHNHAILDGHVHSDCLSQSMAPVFYLDSCTCWMVDTLGLATTCWAWGTAEGMVAEVVGGDDTSLGFWILGND